MVITGKGNPVLRRRPGPVPRAIVTVVLVTLLSLATLPCGFMAGVSTLPGEQSDRTCRIEPLQVCDHGDVLLGVLLDLPVLLPGAPCFFPSLESQPRVQRAVAFVPEGFHPAIDHPPQLSA